MRVDRRVVGVRGAHEIVQRLLEIAQAAQAFAHQDEGLAAVPQAAEVHRRRLQRRDRHFRTQPLDVAALQVRVLDGAAGRDVDAGSPDQLPRPLEELEPIAGERQRVDRRERVHERDDVRRPERRPDELHQRRPRPYRARDLPDVVFVPEDQEDAHVVAAGFRRGMRLGPNRQGELVVRIRLAVGDHVLEALDLLGFAFVLELEVLGLQVRDRQALLVEDDDVDAHEIGAGSKHGALRLRRIG